jgi:hypothetical protein
LKTREVEVYRCWEDRTWDTEFVEVPADTPEAQLAEVCQHVALENLRNSADLPCMVGIYWVPGEEVDLDPEAAITGTNDHQRNLLARAEAAGIQVDKHGGSANGFLLSVPGRPTRLLYGTTAVFQALTALLREVELAPREVLVDIVRTLQAKFETDGATVEWDNQDVAGTVYHKLDENGLI